MAEAQAAILDHEVEAMCCGWQNNNIKGAWILDQSEAIPLALAAYFWALFTREENNLVFCLRHF